MAAAASRSTPVRRPCSLPSGPLPLVGTLVRDEVVRACAADLQAASDVMYNDEGRKEALDENERTLLLLAAVSRSWRAAVLVEGPELRCRCCQERRPQAVFDVLVKTSGCHFCDRGGAPVGRRHKDVEPTPGHWCLRCTKLLAVKGRLGRGPTECWDCSAFRCASCAIAQHGESLDDEWMCDECAEHNPDETCHACDEDGLKPWDAEYCEVCNTTVCRSCSKYCEPCNTPCCSECSSWYEHLFPQTNGTLCRTCEATGNFELEDNDDNNSA